MKRSAKRLTKHKRSRQNEAINKAKGANKCQKYENLKGQRIKETGDKGNSEKGEQKGKKQNKTGAEQSEQMKQKAK